jgi:hypothetical protein
VVFPLPNGSLAVFLAERFRVYVDREGTLRTDHERDLRSIPIVRLHDRLEPKSH